MNLFRKTLFLLFFLATFQLVQAQRVGAPSHNQEYFLDGSVHFGVNAVKIPKVGVSPGISFGFEAGYEHVKIGVGMATTLKKGNAGTKYLQVQSKMDGTTILAPFDSKMGYFNTMFGAKYYLRETSEMPRSNFYGGLSVMVQLFTLKTLNGKYDQSKYTPTDWMVRAYGWSEDNLTGFAAGLSAGYVHTFDSELKLNFSIRYDHNFAIDKNLSNFEHPKLNPLSIGVGIMYTFDMYFGNMSRYGNGR